MSTYCHPLLRKNHCKVWTSLLYEPGTRPLRTRSFHTQLPERQAQDPDPHLQFYIFFAFGVVGLNGPRLKGLSCYRRLSVHLSTLWPFCYSLIIVAFLLLALRALVLFLISAELLTTERLTRYPCYSWHHCRIQLCHDCVYLHPNTGRLEIQLRMSLKFQQQQSSSENALSVRV